MSLDNLVTINRLQKHAATLALRKQRNLADYEGDPITDATLAECLKQAQ